MDLKLKVREIELDNSDMFNYEKYPTDGLFLVIDEVQGNDCGGQLVLRINFNVVFLCNGEHIVFEAESEPEVKTSGGISQELFLKTLPLVVNGKNLISRSSYDSIIDSINRYDFDYSFSL